MMFKPLFKTLLLSVVFFILVVVLGVKYHWVDFLKPTKSDLELVLPQTPSPLEALEKTTLNEPSFSLEIIQSPHQPITANMSKEQILEGCLQLYNKLGVNDDSMIDVIAGDCVVSNYQETIQNTTTQNKSPQQLQQRQALEQNCYQQLKGDTRLTPLEKQLMWGICVSDGVSAN